MPQIGNAIKTLNGGNMYSHKFKTCLLPAFFILLFSTSICSQTNVSGLISSDTTWRKSNSPYIVTGNIMVNEGVTLTIEPGVAVKFSDSKVLQINGTLIAKGNINDTIRFTSNNTVPSKGDWGYIYLTQLSKSATFDPNGFYTSGSILEYAIIEYAGFLSNQDVNAVSLENASPYVNHCIFQNCRNDALSGTVPTLLKVMNSIFCSNGKAAIRVQGALSVDSSAFSKNQIGIYHEYNAISITNSIIQNNTGYGIYHRSFYESHALTLEIRQCLITDNQSDGIYINCDSDNTFMFITNNRILRNGGKGVNTFLGWYKEGTIANNVIANNSKEGIYSTGSDPTTYVKENIVSGNGATGIYSGFQSSGHANILNNVVANNKGGGIYDSSSSGAATVRYNSIISNASFGIRSVNGDSILFNSLSGNNISDSASSYCVYIRGPNHYISNNNYIPRLPTTVIYNDNASNTSSIKVHNNYWGTTADSVIQRRIYDWFDNATKSIVEYVPFLTELDTSAPILPPQGLHATIENGFVLLTWSRNSERDFAGYKIHFGDSIIDIGDTTDYSFAAPQGLDSVALTTYDNAADGQNDQVEGHESWFSYVPISSLTSIFPNDVLTRNKTQWMTFDGRTFRLLAEPNTNIRMEIYDLFGRRLQSITNSIKSSYEFQCKLKSLTSGRYIVKVQYGSETRFIPVLSVKRQ